MEKLPTLTFSQALTTAKSRLLSFNGRSRRSEFWYCYLAAYLVSLVASLIPFIGTPISCIASLLILPIAFRRVHDSGHSGWWIGGGIILSFIALTIIGVTLVSNAKTGNIDWEDDERIMLLITQSFKSVQVIIATLIYIVFSIIQLVFLCQDSQKGPNRYGESPKYPNENAGLQSTDTLE